MTETLRNAGLDQLGELLTEQVDPRYAQIDTASVAQLVDLMNEADAQVPVAVRAVLPQIVAVVEAVTARLSGGGRLFYVGAGSAGRIGVLDAAECQPTFSTPPELVQAIIAGGPEAVVSAQEGVEDDVAAGRAVIAAHGVTAADAVVGIAASGRTPYVLAAVRAARARGAATIGISCNASTPLSAEAELAVEVLVGPEVLAGSTRLKAATAQKLVLNMITTVAMVRLGKTYGNLMVDLRATNAKLRERAIRIVMRAAGADRAAARTALEQVDFDVKLAVLCQRRHLGVEDARRALAAADGRLRQALEARP